jgi:MraZ protein
LGWKVEHNKFKWIASAVSLFLSTTINRVDKKSRVSVPAPFRTALSAEVFQGVILFQSYTQQAIEGVGMSALQDLSNRIDTHFDLFSDAHDDIATILFGESIQCAFDGDGRITLPQKLCDFAEITDQVAFVGLGQKFQLWSPEKLEIRKQEARKSVQDKSITLPPLKGVSND